MRNRADRYLLLISYYAVYLLCFISWIFFRDYYQRKFNYSAIDIIFLVLMSLPLFLPPFVWYGKKRILYFGRKSAGSISMLAAASWYLIFSFVYYNTQEHLFDPFVQLPPPMLDQQEMEKPHRSFRILTLGGSTTQGFRLVKDRSYPSVVRSTLRNSYPFTRIEVFNAGAGWYTTKHSLINYVTYYQDWKPDVTIVMHGINDLFRSCVPTEFAVGSYKEGWSHFYGPAIRGAKPLTFEQFVVKPMLHPWVSTFASQAVHYPSEFYVSKEAFVGNLKKLAGVIKNGNSLPIFITEPSLYKEKMPDEEIQKLWMGQVLCNRKKSFLFDEYPSFFSLYRAMKTFSQIVKSVAASEGVQLIDAEVLISKDLKNFFDDVHFTESGASRLGRIVAAEIAERNLVK